MTRYLIHFPDTGEYIFQTPSTTTTDKARAYRFHFMSLALLTAATDFPGRRTEVEMVNES